MNALRSATPLRVFLIWGVACLPALVGGAAVADAALAGGGPTPFAPWSHSFVTTLWVPLVLLSACLLVMTPGLLFAAGFSGGAGPISFDRWIVYGLGATIPLIAVPAGLLQAATGWSPRGLHFGTLVLVISGVMLAIASRRRSPRDWLPAFSAGKVAAVLLPVLLIAVALLPKLLWETFNGDGAHAYEASRLLLTRSVPFFDPAAGGVAGYPGATSMLFAYPGSWFIRLFGEYEVAARAPFLLYLGVLAAVLTLLCGERADRRLRTRWLVWAGLLPYTLIMAFSATYGRYAADLALPATQDTLLVASFLGFVAAAREESWGWATLFVLLTLTSLPSGLVLIGFWWIAVLAVERGEARRTLLVTAVIVSALSVGIVALTPILSALGLPSPGSEYAGGRILDQLLRLRLTEWQRLTFPVLGCGIAPIAALFAWRKADAFSRVLILVVAAYVIFFFFQDSVAVHHFVPAMLLPLIVLWRSEWSRSNAAGAIVVVLGLTAAALSFPASWRVQSRAREIGAVLEDRRPGYDVSEGSVFGGAEALFHVFARPRNPRVPGELYGDSPLVWLYYANRPARGLRDPNEVAYILADSSEAVPEGRLLGETRGVRAYVRDETVWEIHRRTPGESTVSPRLRIDPRVLYGQDDSGVIDVRNVLGRIIGR